MDNDKYLENINKCKVSNILRDTTDDFILYAVENCLTDYIKQFGLQLLKVFCARELRILLRNICGLVLAIEL